MIWCAFVYYKLNCSVLFDITFKSTIILNVLNVVIKKYILMY